MVQLDGSRSHTHYTEGDPIVQGRLILINWFNNQTKQTLASIAKPLLEFPVGSTVVGLTVQDNSLDSNTAYTNVIVRRPIQPGTYCYYYPASETNTISIDDDISKGTQATFAKLYQDIVFSDFSSFPDTVVSKGARFQMRCSFVIQPSQATGDGDDGDENGTISFSISHIGAVRLLVNDAVVLESSSSDEESTSGTITLSKSDYHYAQLLYTTSNEENEAKLVVDVAGSSHSSKLQYDTSKIIPVVLSIEPLTSTLEGGGSAKLTGIGLENNVKVDLGGSELEIDREKSDHGSVFVTVPPSDKAKRIDVRVKNNAGYSNAVAFEYQADGKPPIIFHESNMTMADDSELNIQLITGIKYGPDHRYYMSAIHSIVYSLETDANLKVLDTICRSSSLGLNRAILGLAFNPSDDPEDFNLYVSGSVLEWEEKERLSGPFAWANGQIILVQKNVGGACLGKVKELITGLPVTNHDHGVNGLVFDQDGKLHIQVGGFTNAGVTDKTRLGGLDANPLSGASLIADVTRPGFNGVIKYSSSNPAQANQVSGDVEVYMAGFRNSFGITLHSNGQLYATDNGASAGFGAMSTSCSTEDELSDENLHDELVKVRQGKYAGHPNRNRGRTDPRQCVFRGPDEPSDGFYEGPIAVFESSTDGIVEYHARTFDSQLKGDLILSKFATQDSEGKVFRVQLDGSGGVKSGPDELWDKSGLTIEMSPYGDLLTPRVFGKRIIVLRAKRRFGLLMPQFIAVSPFRGPRGGGNWVLVTGEDLAEGATAVFAGKPCTETSAVSTDRRSFKCKVPAAAKGATGVRVALRFSDSRKDIDAAPGVDYVYMRK